jgi:pilus assembly protein CpaF
MEGEQMQMHDLFVWEPGGVDQDGHATGRFTATGIRPRCAERIEHRGIQLPSDMFVRRVLDSN